MSLLSAFKSVLAGAGRWIQEAYCSLGQKVGERVEQISDNIAEQRHLAACPLDQPPPGPAPAGPMVELKDHRVINGHRHSS